MIGHLALNFYDNIKCKRNYAAMAFDWRPDESAATTARQNLHYIGMTQCRRLGLSKQIRDTAGMRGQTKRTGLIRFDTGLVTHNDVG